MISAVRYRIYPKDSQKESLAKAFGSCRFLYNKALNHKKSSYESSKTNVSYKELATTFLHSLKEEFPWLRETPSQALQQSLRHLDSAYNCFFKKHNKFPKFKSKYSKQAISLPQGVKVTFEDNTITLPKMGKVKARLHKTFEGDIKTCTVSKTTTNKYYISVLIDNHKELPQIIKGDNFIGIDLGIKRFLTYSTGEYVKNPKFYDQSIDKLQKLQKILSRKVKGSKNYLKIKLKIAILCEKILNQRDNFLHQLSKDIISKNNVIVTENLDVKSLMEKSNSSMSRNIGDTSWSKFITMLKYKAAWSGKQLIQVGRYDPTSKKCSNCGDIYHNLKLEERTWICEGCGKEHDRDHNAAINILKFGMEQAEFKSSADVSPMRSSCL